ncbi:MlaD family protein [Paroceanicella profunda]|uniref:MlaD family protein n=1 Tax=Paroceanicella profunda TaxID=2579971 RepID=UPI0014788683|nr:MlaD family protein [Paroceanicella profunda]
MTDETPEPEAPTIQDRRRLPSVVWLVPLGAIAVSLFLLWQNFADRGPLIEISFAKASGITPGQTRIKYRDVDVGHVETVSFSRDLERVVVTARMDKTVAPFLDDSARFWVVRPQITAQGITGLDTVISGSYIEGAWDNVPGDEQSTFKGLDESPLTPADTPGLRVVLRGTDGGSLSVGAPVMFRGVEVGKVESKRLTADGRAVEFDVFINAPNSERLSTSTRFWNVSGVKFTLGPQGAQLQVASLASLIQGGASFDEIGTGAPAEEVEEGHVYTLFNSETEARDLVIEGDLEDQLQLAVLFTGSVRGLSAGANVEYRGIKVGQVVDVFASVDPTDSSFRTRTTIALQPQRLGLERGDRQATLDFVRQAVRNGLRAKLAMGNLLTGALYVDLVDDPRAQPASLDESQRPYPMLPSVPSDLAEITGSVEGVLDRVNNLPIEALLNNAVTLLDNMNAIVASEGTREAPARIAGILASVEKLVSDPALQQSLTDTQAALSAVRRFAESPELQSSPATLSALLTTIDGMASRLQQSGAVDNITAAVAALRGLAEDPDLAALPASVRGGVDALTALLEDPEMKALPGRISASLDSLRSLLDQPSTKQLPEEINASLAALRARLADPKLAEAVAAIPPTLDAARQTLSQFSQNADPVLASLRRILDDPGTKALPGDAASALRAARDLMDDAGLRAAVGEAGGTLAALRRILDQDSARATPQQLSDTLQSARDLLASLEKEGAAKNLSAALASARTLLDDPALREVTTQLSQTLEALRAVLGAPGVDELPTATRDALRSATALLDDLQREKLGEAASAALRGVQETTVVARQALNELPGLLRQLASLSREADQVLASVSVGSELNYEAVTAIREIRDAARAVTDLAELIQQQPNSLIIGK